MMNRRWFPFLSAAALGLLCLGAQRGQAGSFFGPFCYGARYTEQYPNRSHNQFGCNAGYGCPTWHPVAKMRRWVRRDRAMRRNAAANGCPCAAESAPVLAAPMPAAPVPAATMPQTAAPAPLPAGPANPETPPV